MSKFYTNIEVRGNTILYRGYDNGMPIQQKIAYRPHLFVKTNEQTQYKVFKSQEPVKKKTFDSINDMKDFVEQFKDVPNFGVYGCTHLVRQFTGNEFRGEIDWDFKQVQLWFFDIETKAENGFPKPEIADQEILLITMINYQTKDIHIWSAKPVEKDNKIFDLYKEGYTLKFQCFETEKQLLKDFLVFFASTRIDVISGWNSELFDIPYIVNRIKRVLGDEVVKMLSPWKIVKERQVRFDNGDTKQTYDILGVTHLDYIELYKKFNPGSQESFKLDFIAMKELGEGKVDLPGESFQDGYNLHYNMFVWYNAIDVILLCKLEKKMMLVMLAMQLAFIAKCQFGDVLSAMRLWESIIYNYFLDENIVETLEKERTEKHSIVGAYVHDPVPGKYGWTVSVDATSLYPSIMMQNNISPETILDYQDSISIDKCLSGSVSVKNDTSIISANGLTTTKEFRGFIPILVERMFDLRKKTKNRMLDLKKQNAPEEEYAALDVAQKAFKIAANSFYGVTGLQHFRYYDYRLAEAVTSTGQIYIKKAKEILDELLSKLSNNIDVSTYLDTDSIYFSCDGIVAAKCQTMNDSEIVNYLEKFVFDIVQPYLNKKLLEFSTKFGIDDCKIFFKLECIGPSIIFVAKKRYAFDILYSEGVRYEKPKMKVMGIEIVRSSTPSVVKDYLKESLALCLRSDEKSLQKKVKEVRESFMQHHYKDISFPRGVNGLSTYSNAASIYKSGCPIHVRGALLYNNQLQRKNLHTKYPLIAEGDKIKFVALKMPNPIHENVIAFSKTIPSELGLDSYIDYNVQFEKSFLAPLEGILNAIKWTAEEKVTLDFD